MAGATVTLILRKLRDLPDEAAGDAELLARYVGRHDEAAFAALLHRHGPMVLGVCRRLLRQTQDVEDVFQATFLVLARRASAVRKRQSLASFLHGVARRLALKLRGQSARRPQTGPMREPLARSDPGFEAAWRELLAVLDEEMRRLPERYRLPLVLCYLEGHTHEEAARALGWPLGTVKGRLARGRDRLRVRLTRRGLALPSGAFAAVLIANEARSVVPAALARAALAAVREPSSGSPTALTLAEGVIQAMSVHKLKMATIVMLTLGALSLGAGAFFHAAHSQTPAPPPEATAPPAANKKPATMPEVKGEQGGDGRRNVRSLNFRFKDLRFITIKGGEKVPQSICYLWYEVRNPTKQPFNFIPNFQLLSLDRPAVHHDEVSPKVMPFIRSLEDPTNQLRIHDSVSIAAEPIPAAKKGEEAPAVVGVAVWQNVDPDAARYIVLVEGLSNAWSAVNKGGENVVRRKVLQLNFRREGEAMHFAAPADWWYRASVPSTTKERETERLRRYLKQLTREQEQLLREQEMNKEELLFRLAAERRDKQIKLGIEKEFVNKSIRDLGIEKRNTPPAGRDVNERP